MVTVIIIINTRPPMTSRAYWRSPLIFSICFFSLSGCALVPGLDLSVDHKNIGAPEELGGFDLIEVTPKVLLELAENVDPDRFRSNIEGVSGAERNEYMVGAGDVLTIIVWDHPELTSPTGEFRDPESSGRLVGSDGKIFYPYIGELEVGGLPVSSIRRLISAQLARVVRDPQVDVRVAAFRSQRVKVTGEVANPAVLPITDRGLSVLEAIASTGGLTGEASRRLVILRRGDSEYQIDIKDRIGSESLAGDVILQHGDELHIPNSDEYAVYVLGAVGAQAAIPLPRGSMSLAEAISRVDGLDANTADRSRIYVVRAEPRGMGQRNQSQSRLVVYIVDMSRITSLILSERFDLFPRDVVYVDRTGLATYNSIVSQILPTVSTLFQLDRLVDN